MEQPEILFYFTFKVDGKYTEYSFRKVYLGISFYFLVTEEGTTNTYDLNAVLGEHNQFAFSGIVPKDLKDSEKDINSYILKQGIITNM